MAGVLLKSKLKEKRGLFYFMFFKQISFFIVVQVQLSPFFPYHAPPLHPTLPPTLEHASFGFVPVSFIHVP